MAVALDRFSIREYAARMRGADPGKCWPFGGEGGGAAALPPMPVRHFRLWSDEVEAVRAPAAPAAELVATEAPAEEGRPSKGYGRGKQRALKKRSIAELFAVAPPVDTKGEGGAGDVARREAEDDCVAAVIRKRKKKKKKIAAAKKEKVRKSELPSSVNISHILKDLVHKKWLEKSSSNLADGQKKKPTVAKHLKKKSTVKLKETSKLNSRNCRDFAKLPPVHGILKNRNSGISAKKANKSVDAHGDNIVKLCCESGKHVSFSIKDVMLGGHKSCSGIELSELQSLCKIFSDVLAASSGIGSSNKIDKRAVSLKGVQGFNTGDTNVSSHVFEQADGSLSGQRQLSCSNAHAASPTPVTPQETNCVDTEKTLMTENLDLNAVQSDNDLICVNHVTSTLSPNLKYSGNPKDLNIIYSSVSNSDAEIHAQESITRMSDAYCEFGPTEKCVSGSDTVSSLTITSTSGSKDPASCLVKSMDANGKLAQSSVDPKRDFLSHIPTFQPLDHFPPKDLIGSMCSSVGSKRSGESSLISDPGSTSKDKFIFEDFIGLPLNSQGELIKLHSGAKLDFNEFYKKQNTEFGPVHGFNEFYTNSVDHAKMKVKISGTSMYQTDQSNWFSEQYCPASNPVDSSELQCFERMKFQNHESVNDKDQCVHPADNPVRISCQGCRNIQIHNARGSGMFQAGGIRNHEFQSVVHPTMRLMGQNVTVGKSNKECRGFNNGRSWTGKDFMMESCSSVRVSNKPLLDHWPQQELVAPLTSRSPREIPFQPPTQSNFYCTPPLLPRSNFECQSQWMARNDVSWIIGDHSSNVNLFRRPLPSQLLQNESNSMFNTVSETEPAKMRHHLPVVYHRHNVCHHMLPCSTHCKHNDSIPYISSSTSTPPFPYQGHADLSRTSLAPALPDLPQWLLNDNQHRKTQPCFCPPYSRPADVNPPCGLVGTDLIPIHPQYSTSMVPLPVCNSNKTQICGSFTTPDSIRYPSFIPTITANRVGSVVNSTFPDKNKSRNRTISKIAYFEGLDQADQSRKRLAGSDEFIKPSKKRFLKIPDDSNAPTCHRTREELHGYTQHNIVTQESHINQIDVGIPAMTNEKDGLRSASGGSRPGPIKLTAGAKHILKPSLDMNKDYHRPIHSTIPFSTGTSSDKLPVSQKATVKAFKVRLQHQFQRQVVATPSYIDQGEVHAPQIKHTKVTLEENSSGVLQDWNIYMVVRHRSASLDL